MADPHAPPLEPLLNGSARASRLVHIDSPIGGMLSNPGQAFYGWVAVDTPGPIEKLSLVNTLGTCLPLALVARPDVATSVPSMTSAGFSGWIDIRTISDGPWSIRCTQADLSFDIACQLVADGSIVAHFSAAKSRKLALVRELLRCPRCRTALSDDGPKLRCPAGHIFHRRGDAFDLLDDALRADVGAVSTDNVSAHGYDGTLLELIAQSAGPILDVGAGLRPTYREDVINVEIVPYPTTDVVAASEFLPFADDTFDLVISVAVLEHVRDPFAAARELSRVLRGGGRVFAAVPFLQPYHGYPDHFYNMTAAGLRNLFAELDVEQLNVPQSGGPLFALTWILQAWHRALPPDVAADFANMRVADLAVDPMQLVTMPFVRELPAITNTQLAALNVLVGRKPI